MMRRIAASLLMLVVPPVFGQSRGPQPVPLKDGLPANVRADEIVANAGAQRLYYTVETDKVIGEIWRYDRATKESSRLVSGALWDLTIAPNGSALAYSKESENGDAEYVWTIPLDPRTGLAAGPERRVSTVPGDTPAFSPDGKWIAFGRSDSLGQSLAVVPLSGGPARILATISGNDIGSINWTPDSKALYFSAGFSRGGRETGVIRRVALSAPCRTSLRRRVAR